MVPTLTVGPLVQTYFIHIPDGPNNQQLVPLVFVFHGCEEKGSYARSYTGNAS